VCGPELRNATGRAPHTLLAVMPAVRDYPAAMKLPAARMLGIRSFVSVPVALSDGRGAREGRLRPVGARRPLYGTFCAAGFTADEALTTREQALMDVLAHAASVTSNPVCSSRPAGARSPAGWAR